MPNATTVVEAAITRVADKMTPRLQNTALELGWPKDAAKRLTLIHSEGMLIAKYDGPDEEVEDLEFGTTRTPPRAAIGNFFGSHQIKKEIQKTTNQSMDEIVASIERLFS
jgi:hypothetical protein